MLIPTTARSRRPLTSEEVAPRSIRATRATPLGTAQPRACPNTPCIRQTLRVVGDQGKGMDLTVRCSS